MIFYLSKRWWFGSGLAVVFAANKYVRPNGLQNCMKMTQVEAGVHIKMLH
jgi:hypothetical protein